MGVARAGEKDSIDLLNAATKGISSYDLKVSSYVKHLLAADSKTNDQGKTESIRRPLKAGEDAITDKTSYRQVLHRGKRRIEAFEGSVDTPTLIMVFDGETERMLTGKRGSIRLLQPRTVEIGADYLNLYRTVYGRYDIVTMLRQRSMVEAKTIGSKDKVGLTFDGAPEPDKEFPFARFGLAITADATHGLMPTMLEVYQNDDKLGRLTRFKTVIEKFKRLADGSWVPVQATTTFYEMKDPQFLRKPWLEVVTTVDEDNSRWNIAVPDETFTLQFPVGTNVVDEIRKVMFVTGKADPGRNIDDLLRNARNVVPIEPGTPILSEKSRGLGKALLTYLALALLALLSLFAFVYVRKVRKGTAHI